MEVKKHEKYTLVILKKSLKSNFFQDFKEKYSTFENEHLIIDASAQISFSDEDIENLTVYGGEKRENGTSFVVISNKLDAEELEGSLNVTPTLTEAVDIIEMEEIERDLGF